MYSCIISDVIVISHGIQSIDVVCCKTNILFLQRYESIIHNRVFIIHFT